MRDNKREMLEDEKKELWHNFKHDNEKQEQVGNTGKTQVRQEEKKVRVCVCGCVCRQVGEGKWRRMEEILKG